MDREDNARRLESDGLSLHANIFGGDDGWIERVRARRLCVNFFGCGKIEFTEEKK